MSYSICVMLAFSALAKASENFEAYDYDATDYDYNATDITLNDIQSTGSKKGSKGSKKGGSYGTGPTSLERAFDKAFNDLVGDGTYAGIFGDLTGLTKGTFCSGSPDWPIPEVDSGSDLERALERGKFICGYNAGLEFTTDSGQLILETKELGASGAIVDWWNAMAEKIGEYYHTPDFKVKWDTSFTSSQDTLDAVQNGDIDAACARWGQDGFWNNAEGKKVPRAYGLSAQHCPTYFQQGKIFTRVADGLNSFSDVIDTIKGGEDLFVCVPARADTGDEQSCTAIFTQYTGKEYACVGQEAEAFPNLANGSCDVCWAGGRRPDSGIADQFVSFNQPTLYVAGTFFRRQDLH